jgi:hypothetical protein
LVLSPVSGDDATNQGAKSMSVSARILCVLCVVALLFPAALFALLPAAQIVA